MLSSQADMNQIVASAENMVLPDLGDLSLDDYYQQDQAHDSQTADGDVGIAAGYHRNKAIDHPRSLNESSLLMEPPVKRAKQPITVPTHSIPSRSNSYAVPVRSNSAGRMPPATAITSVSSGVVTRSKARANSFNVPGSSSGYISSNNSVGSAGATTRSSSRNRSKVGGDNSSVGSYNSTNRTSSTVSTRSEEAIRKHQVNCLLLPFILNMVFIICPTLSLATHGAKKLHSSSEREDLLSH